jgi:hypothetical protein
MAANKAREEEKRKINLRKLKTPATAPDLNLLIANVIIIKLSYHQLSLKREQMAKEGSAVVFRELISLWLLRFYC